MNPTQPENQRPDANQLFNLSAAEATDLLRRYWRLDELTVRGRYEPHPTKTAVGLVKNLHQLIGNRLLWSPEPKWRPNVFVFGSQDANCQPLEAGQWYEVAISVTEPDKRRREIDMLVAVPGTLRRVEAPVRLEKTVEQQTESGNEQTQLIKRRQQQLAPAVERAQRRREVEATLAERTDMGAWAAGALNRSLAKITARLATATDRMFWELLQNADDKPNKTGHQPNVTFELLTNYLVFLHNGQPFSQADMRGISDVADGTKEEEEDMTGYKGIGFKAVFATSRAMYLHSGGYTFRFAPEPTEDPKKVPWMIWPRWTELMQLPQELLEYDPYFQSVASSVAIALEVGNEQVQRYSTLLPNTFAAPVFLLFLRHVRSVRLAGLPTPLLLRRHDANSTLIELYSNERKLLYRRQDFWIEVTDAQREAAEQDDFMPDSLKQASRLKLTLATPLSGKGPEAVASDEAILYCYLPTTDDHYQLPALVNADFLTDPSREKVLPEKVWNNELFEAIGGTWPKWLASMLTEQPQWVDSVYKLLPVCYEGKMNANQLSFNEGIKRAVIGTKFILTAEGKLVVPAAAILDEAGLAAVLPELYAAHLTQGLQLVHPAAAQVLTPGQVKLLGLKKITQANVLALLGKASTSYTPYAAARLLQYVYEHGGTGMLVQLKSVAWLFDQNAKAMAPNGVGQYGVVDEQPDADMPFSGTFRYLHLSIQPILQQNSELRVWFEEQFPALRPLTRAKAIADFGNRLDTGKVTAVEAASAAGYLYKLFGRNELDLVGTEKTLNKLVVRTKTGNWVPVTQAYLPDFYEPAYPIETLIAGLGSDKFPFVAADYCTAHEAALWGKFWGKLGVKRPEAADLLVKDFIPLLQGNRLIDDGHDALARFAITLYSKSSRGVLDSEWGKFGALRLQTVGGARQPLTDCVIPDTYPTVPAIVDQLLPQGLSTMLAADYTKVGKVPPALVRQFLADATGQKLVSSEEVVELVLRHLIEVETPEDETESVRVVHELVHLAEVKQLHGGLRPLLHRLPLFLKDGTQQAAGACFLSSVYKPEIDIEQLGETAKVISDAYLTGKISAESVKALLIDWLGVHEKFELQWYPKVSISRSTSSPMLQPYWQYVKSQNSGLTNQVIEFSNLLVISNLQLVSNEKLAEKLAASLANDWPNKPQLFPKATYRIGNGDVLPISPWLGPPKIYLRGPAGQSPQIGQRHLSQSLLKKAPKSAWVAVHSYGSPELEQYLGLQTELNLAEQLAAFAEATQSLQKDPVTGSQQRKKFEKIVSPLLAHFQAPVKASELPAWRSELMWPAADGSWQPLKDLHWLGGGAEKYYSTGRNQLVQQVDGQREAMKNFCIALGVSMVNMDDFKAVTPSDGGVNHSLEFQRRVEQNQLARLLVHNRFGYDEPKVLSQLHERLAALHFIEVDTVTMECTRIPGFEVPLEERCLVDKDSKTFYFSGALFSSWRHLGALGKFLKKQLGIDISSQVLVDILRATSDRELRLCLVDANWNIPDWLEQPEAAKTQAPPVSNPRTEAPGGNPRNGFTAPATEAETTIYQGDGGAHSLYKPDVPAGIRKDYQKEAREAAVPWLKQHGFALDAEGHDGYSTFDAVTKTSDDTTWRVVVKSYKGGILYLNPNEWLTLADERSLLLLYKPRPGQAASDSIELITSLEAVHQRNPNLIVRLHNTDVAGSVANLTKLAEAYQFSSSFKFIFDSPSNEAFDFDLTTNHKATGTLPASAPEIDLF